MTTKLPDKLFVAGTVALEGTEQCFRGAIW